MTCVIPALWGPTSDPAIRNAVWDMTGGICADCRVRLSPSKGRATSMHVDHIVPRSRGGIDHTSNYQPLCARCNMSKGASNCRDHRHETARPAKPAPSPRPTSRPATAPPLVKLLAVIIVTPLAAVAKANAGRRAARRAEPRLAAERVERAAAAQARDAARAERAHAAYAERVAKLAAKRARIEARRPQRQRILRRCAIATLAPIGAVAYWNIMLRIGLAVLGLAEAAL